MHYYQRNIGDYARDTGHLTVLEHGLYALMLDWYYLNERPITDFDLLRISRGMVNEARTILSEYFKETEDGWVHSYADRIIAAYHAKAETNRKNGQSGGRPRATSNPEETQTVTTANPTVTLTSNQEPITKKEQKQKTGSPTGSRLPTDWTLPDDWRLWAQHERPDVDADREADKFRDFWHGKAGKDARKADWLATWRNWIRRADGSRSRTAPQQQPGKRMQALMRLEAMKNGLGDSGNHNGDSAPLLLGTGPGAGFGNGRGNGSGVG